MAEQYLPMMGPLMNCLELKKPWPNIKNKFKYLGINSRLDSIQAAVLLEKIQILNQEIELRQSNANRYSGLLSCNEQILQTPEVIKNGSSVWAQYTIKIHNRDLVVDNLKKKIFPMLFTMKNLCTTTHHIVDLEVRLIAQLPRKFVVGC